MTSSKFNVSTHVNKDRTQIKPYSIHVKVTFMDNEFKSRINNYINATDPVVVFESIAIPFFSVLFNKSREEVSIIPAHTLPFKNTIDYQDKLSIKKFLLQDDLLSSDVEGMAFSELEVAVRAQHLVEKEITNLLLQQEKIFMSI